MDAIQHHRLSFYIALTPSNLRKNYVYVPLVLVAPLKNVLPRKVYFHVANGDIYECLFESEEGSFIGLGKIIERFNLGPFSFLFFEHFGKGGFMVSAINSTCVEVEYPMRGDFFSTVFDNFTDVVKRSSVHPSHAYSIVEDVNGSLFHYNSDATDERGIHIMFDSMAMVRGTSAALVESQYNDLCKNFQDETEVFLLLCERSWTVKVRKMSGSFYLCEGWKTLISDIEVCLGDLLVLNKTTGNHIFGIALFRNYISCGKNIMLYGAHIPNKFFKLVSIDLLSSGELVVPKIFYDLYSKDIPEKVLFKCGQSVIFSGAFNYVTHKFTELQQMLEKMNAEDGDGYLFIYEGHGVFVICHFTTTYAQKNCGTQLMETSCRLRLDTM